MVQKKKSEQMVERYVQQIDNLNNENVMYGEQIVKKDGIIQ